MLAVRDDGGTAGDWTPGVGIASMRERSLQVGGTLTAYATRDGGLVEASIPLGPRGLRITGCVVSVVVLQDSARRA